MGACVGSAALGTIALRLSWGTVTAVAFDVATVWTLSANWLDGRFTVAAVKRLLRAPSTPSRHPARDRPAGNTSLAVVMNRGGCILILAGVIPLLAR